MMPRRALLIALQFLTCLPITLRQAPHDREVGFSALFYPLVGLILAGLLEPLLHLALHSQATPFFWAAITLSAWVLLTGGLHLDGLADSVDAWKGGLGQRERTLALMKDPHCGPMAIIALFLVLTLKLAALEVLALDGQWILLGLPLVLGRLALVLLFLSTPYARAQGLGFALSHHLPRKPAILVLALTTGALMIVFKVLGVLSCVASLGVFLVLRRALLQRLGGTTGDTAGALVELTETTVLLLCAGTLRYTL